jgi:hypothetical protein
VLLFAAGCGTLLPQPRERRILEVPGTHFTRLAVIAGSDEGNGPLMARRVRSALRDEVTISPVTGVFSDEAEAVARICSGDATDGPPPNGVVIVLWNRLSLRDCETRRTAYEVQGAYEGTEQMTRRLTAYLRNEES